MTTAWIDANVIVRLVVNDPPDQAMRARRYMRRAEDGEFTLRLSPLILAEVVFVLDHVYHHGRIAIAEALGEFLDANGIEAEEADAARAALAVFAESALDFPDAYLAAIALLRDDPVCTFDEDLKKRVAAV